MGDKDKKDKDKKPAAKEVRDHDGARSSPTQVDEEGLLAKFKETLTNEKLEVPDQDTYVLRDVES